MSIFIGTSNPSKIFVGSTEVASVWSGTTKIRPSSRLPSGYQEVERIGTSGTQYINTFYNPTSTSSAVVVFEGTTIPSRQELWIFAIYDSGCRRRAGWVYGSLWPGEGFSYTSSGNVITGTGSTTSSYPSSPYSLFLFAQNESGTVYHLRGAMKLYSCKIYSSSGVLARDFVPCYRTSDSVIGLYDIVNDVFYTNQGSGTFTKGDDV